MAWSECLEKHHDVVILLMGRNRVSKRKIWKIKSRPCNRAVCVSPCLPLQLSTVPLFLTCRTIWSAGLPHCPSAWTTPSSRFSQRPQFCGLRSSLKCPPLEAVHATLPNARSHFTLLFSLLLISSTELIRFLIIVFMTAHILFFICLPLA